MRLVAALLLVVTVVDVLWVCYALDDDEGEDSKNKYAVQFFQFRTKDLNGILGGHKKNHYKRDIKKSDEPPALAAKQNETLAQPENATVVKSSNDSVVPTNATEVSVSPANETIATSAPSNATVVPQNATVTPQNATVIPQNATEASTLENSTAPAIPSDVNIMNALINLAVQKTNTSSVSNESSAVKANSTSSAPEAKPAAAAAVSNMTASPVAKKTATTKTVDTVAVKRARIAASTRRDKVLDPNPKPSPQEAALNVKAPLQLENKEHDAMIHKENTTKTDTSENKHETTTESVEMIKNPDPPANPSPDNSTSSAVQNSTAPTLIATVDGEEQKKAEKEKEEPKKDVSLKDIPLQNNASFDNSSNVSEDLMKQALVQTANTRTKVEPAAKHADERTIKHRKKVSEFVPLYKKTTPKDHKLSFQVGSLKHPKHNIHPKCHACPHNSTYKECVKKSTLRECNEGLNNICFTKSSKKNGIITYEMGCSDHNKCVHAKAFPCKDGKEHCFTCCQYDRCNSSPHHGDYELDELNLSELSDAASSASLTDTTTYDSKSTAATFSSAPIGLTIASSICIAAYSLLNQ